ncbi:MAG: cyclic nucleotide-binding domain-containing protein [Chromatiaceae bacterium]|nr:cyclic nucleotide-binding domain-containing protein [Gammaproteobacteria bacterium]MCP5305716.1 cyclic nucleotide-binding domain-containing protein [Chromatiaceae bacterium]MCP5312573.1 cyclic nucleotide-binding domain-containing protein [Chromatiaceae bacterium]
MATSRVRLLQQMAIFGGLSESVITHLLDGAEVREVPAGSCIFSEGDIDNSIYVIEHGTVSVFRHWEGRDYLLRKLGAGDCFGEMALMDCKPRSASVYADEPCGLIRIASAQLGELYAVDVEQYVLIHMNLGREVCRRLSEADKRLFAYEYVGKPARRPH